VRPDAIVTERLLLRPLGRALAGAIAAGDYSGLSPGPGWPTETTAIVALRAAADPGALTWLIVRDGLVIGECGLKHAPGPDGSTEIGYGVGTAWRGRGFGAEAVHGLVEWLANVPACRRLTAEVHETNLASRRLLERLGFTVERLSPPYVWYSRLTRATAPPARNRRGLSR
jgi:RimJ/RimL family protein N-acetyltransferase